MIDECDTNIDSKIEIPTERWGAEFVRMRRFPLLRLRSIGDYAMNIAFHLCFTRQANSDFEKTDEDRLRRAIDLDNGIQPYKPSPDDVYPYSDSSGEVASYRLQLFLNDLGKAYLRVSNFLDAAETESLL